MNNRIKRAFFIVKNNIVIAYDTNLKDLLAKAPKEINLKSYSFFYNQFSKNDFFEFEGYYFQKKLMNKKPFTANGFNKK